MGHHQKVASCINLSSLNGLNNNTAPSSTTNPNTPTPNTTQPNTILLPSYCLYSKRALLNEYAPESDIIQYLYPKSNNQFLKERLPMFVGVLQSLFTVVNDMPFFSDEDDDNDEAMNDTSEDSDSDRSILDDNDSKLQFNSTRQPPTLDGKKGNQTKEAHKDVSIVGLHTMKLVVWHQPLHLDRTGDLSLVIIVSAHVSDGTILKNMEVLKQKCLKQECNSHVQAAEERPTIVNDIPSTEQTRTSEEIGDQLHQFIYTYFIETNDKCQ